MPSTSSAENVLSETLDVVYLWVDGSDPTWRARRAVDAKHHAEAAGYGYSNVEGRFRDNGELKYSLRALSRHLDKVGHIYLVTDDQRPSWLAEHPRLRVVSHSEMRPYSGSTYSSTCLEAWVHRIPGISDWVLYLNDDVFLGSNFTTEDLLFCDGRHKIYFEPVEAGADPLQTHIAAADVSRVFLSAAIPEYQHLDSVFMHVAKIFRVLWLNRLEIEFPDAFAQARSEVFRKPGTPLTLTDLYPRWLHAKGLATVCDAPHRTISSGAANLDWQLEDFIHHFSQLKFFCINDTLDNAPADHPALLKIADMLETLYPTPSIFERPV